MLPVSANTQATPAPTPSAPQSVAADTAATAKRAPEAPPANPDGVLDPKLGIAVLQFRDRSGEVVQTYPSQKQLDAYTEAQSARPAPASVVS